jgi:hypothetical protein
MRGSLIAGDDPARLRDRLLIDSLAAQKFDERLVIRLIIIVIVTGMMLVRVLRTLAFEVDVRTRAIERPRLGLPQEIIKVVATSSERSSRSSSSSTPVRNFLSRSLASCSRPEGAGGPARRLSGNSSCAIVPLRPQRAPLRSTRSPTLFKYRPA